jgi:hypothetical protein
MLYSLSLTSLWVSAISLLIILACNGIPKSQEISSALDLPQDGDYQMLTQQQRLLHNIYNWLEPQEKLYEFTIGHYRGMSSGIMLVLTSKYLRLASMEGGRNFPLHEIQNIEWAGLWARIKIYTVTSGQPLIFLVWGKEWKKRAKKIAEDWKQLDTQIHTK